MIATRMPTPARRPYSATGIARIAVLTLAILLIAPALASPALGTETADACSLTELALYLALAHASEQAYDDSQPGLESTPSGCVALVRDDADGNLIIAFRGSMLGDRNPRHRFSNLGGANVRRTYRDWVATNLKQTTGFLPRQYVEAASLVEKHALAHPADKLIYITGHSKGGGAATYAYVAASVASATSRRQAGRLRCITFNAAVVKEQNWRRLFRRLGQDAAITVKEPAAASVTALIMSDDPVSQIAASEERGYVTRITIAPSTDLPPLEQHAIRTIIAELEKLKKTAEQQSRQRPTTPLKK